jgi:hypothetical protein
VKRDSVRDYSPYLAPFVIVALGWALLIRPASAENARIARELVELRDRIAALRSQQLGPAVPGEDAVDPVAAFERHVAAGDASGRLLEELSRVARASGVGIETLETGAQSDVRPRSGPAVADAAMPDPRVALFETSLSYTPVTLTAEADYRSLGEFFWRFRDMTTLTEIRTLEVATSAAPRGDPGAGGVLRVTLTLFAYSRTGADDPASGPRTDEPASPIPSAEAAE